MDCFHRYNTWAIFPLFQSVWDDQFLCVSCFYCTRRRTPSRHNFTLVFGLWSRPFFLFLCLGRISLWFHWSLKHLQYSLQRTGINSVFVFVFLRLISFFPQLYLYEAVARLMAGANPTETHHLLQRSTLRQRVVTSCHHKGNHQEDAGMKEKNGSVF